MRPHRWTLTPLLSLLATACPPLPIDPDGDGYVEDDCAAHYASVHTGAADPYGDGVDQDCDGWDGTESEFDLDGDGQRSTAYDGRDCDDDKAAIYAGAEELCGDGFVNDCDRSAVSASLDCRMDGELLETEGARYTVIVGHAAGAWAGYRVTDAGDVDGDGKDDVLVGAPTGNSSIVMPGAAYLITDPLQGTIDMSQSEDTVLLGSLDGDLAGAGIAGVGDLNDDNYGDIAVGSAGGIYGVDGREGMLQFLYGPLFPNSDGSPKSLVDEADLTISGPAGFGYYVSPIGDADGDGLGDLSVAAYSAYEGRGAIYVVTARDIDAAVASTTSVSMEIVGVETGETGRSTCGGDMDGDGLSEVVTGAWQEVGTTDGHAYEGSVSGISVSPGTWSASAADFTLVAEQSGDNLGWAVACGDLTGDGLADVVAGAPGFDGGGDRPGVAYLLPANIITRGSPVSVKEASVAVLTGAFDGGGFGAAISVSGDMDGDGRSDLLVGSNTYISGAPWPSGFGAAYLFYASGGMEGSVSAMDAHAVMTGQGAGDAAGNSVSEGGDIDGDGWPDLLVGAPGDSQTATQSGRAYILYGGGY